MQQVLIFPKIKKKGRAQTAANFPDNEKFLANTSTYILLSRLELQMRICDATSVHNLKMSFRLLFINWVVKERISAAQRSYGNAVVSEKKKTDFVFFSSSALSSTVLPF